MHDSFNPQCREGVISADWSKEWVHHVETDFTVGNVMPQSHVCGQLWGGLSLAELSPSDRLGKQTIHQTGQLLFSAAQRERQRATKVHMRILRKLRGLLKS